MATQIFLQERVINGVLAHREAPNKPWLTYTAEELSIKVEQIQSEAQREVGAALQEKQDAQKKVIAEAVKKERERILAIVASEEEPGTNLSAEQQQKLEGISRVELTNLVVRVTKQSIRKRIETV